MAYWPSICCCHMDIAVNPLTEKIHYINVKFQTFVLLTTTWKLETRWFTGTVVGGHQRLLLRQLEAEHGHQLVRHGNCDVEAVGKRQHVPDHVEAGLDAPSVYDVQQRLDHVTVTVRKVQDGVFLISCHIQNLFKVG